MPSKTITDLLLSSCQTWGGKKLVLDQIIVRMGKIFGDICRYARNEKPDDAPGEDDLKKELGNMIVSTIRWCDDLGYDPDECIKIALKAQEEFPKK